MSKGKPLTHSIKNQLEYQYIMGPVKIKDGLFIGDEFAAKDIEFIHTNKVTHVINTVARRIPNIWEKIGVQYLCFNWTDTDWNIFDKKNAVLNSIFAFIEEALELGQCCLIHSLNSKSRSFLVVAAYLMKKYSWSLDKIFSFVNSKKPGIQIKGVYTKQLRDLEERMNKIHTFSLNWDDAKNEDDLILKNTYLNSFPIQFDQIYKPGKFNNKKVSWQQTDIKPNRFKEDKKKVIYENLKETKKQKQQQKQQVVKSILKSTAKVKQLKEEESTNIINNINGNIIHLTVNNFISPDDEAKTAIKSTNPLMMRPYSSDTKDKKKDVPIKDKTGTYESFLNFKSPYESKQPGEKFKRAGFGSKMGMNDTFKRTNDAFKQTYQRPLSANNPDKKKLNSNKPTTSVTNPMFKDLVVTNTRKPLIGGRYPSPMVKDSTSTMSQLRDKWRRDL